MVSCFVYNIDLLQAAATPIAPSSEEDHYLLVMMVENTMWFLGYRGMLDPADFAYACSVHAQEGIATMQGANKSFAFKCPAVEISLLVHVFRTCVCCSGTYNCNIQIKNTHAQ